MDKKTAKKLMAELDVVLSEFAKEKGLSFEFGRGRIDASSVKLPAIFTELNSEGVAETKELRALRLYMPEMEGKTFKSRGRTFTITGYNTRAHKMPIQAVSTAGERYKFGADTVRRLVG